MFRDATAFNQDIGAWDTSNVRRMIHMFNGANSFSNHDLSGWNVSHVVYHNNFSTNWGIGNTEPIW